MKKKWLLAVALVVVFLCDSAALALDFMGPPTSGLKKGQFSTGADYSYSRMDLQLNEGKMKIDGESGDLPSGKIKNLKMNKVYANIGYGIMDNWEMFLRLGGANTDLKTDLFDAGSVQKEFDGDTGFAIGFGTKATFYEEGDLKLGGLFQMSWASSDAKANGPYWSESLDIDITEIQIAAGPTYKLMSSVSIYGGPFFHFIDGDADANLRIDGTTVKNSYDIDEVGCFGGYIGAQVEVIENVPFCIEYQHTAAADALAMSLIWRLP